RCLGQLRLAEAGAAAGAHQHHGEHDGRHPDRAHPLPPYSHRAPALGPQKEPEGTAGPPNGPVGGVLTDSSHAADTLLIGAADTASVTSDESGVEAMLKRNLAVLVLTGALLAGGAFAWAQTGDGSPTAPTTAPNAQQAPGQRGQRGQRANGYLKRVVHGDLVVRGKDGFQNVS